MPRFSAWFADVFSRQRAPYLLLALLLSALTGWGIVAPSRGTIAGGRLGDDPERDFWHEVESAFPTDSEWSFVVLDGEDVFTPKTIAAARRAAVAVAGLDQVRRVVWLGDIPVFAGGFLPQPLLPAASDTDADAVRRARATALAHPLIAGHLLSRDCTTLLLPIVQGNYFVRRASSTVPALAAAARAAVADSGLRARVTGATPLRVERFAALDRDQLVFTIVGLVLSIVVALFLFRSWSAVFIVSVAPAVGVVWTLGVLRLLGLTPGPLTFAIMPLMILMVGFTDGVHLMVHVRGERASGASPVAAAASAIQRLGGACALTSLTTAVGFGSLLAARIPMIRAFGLSCAVGVVLVFASVLTVLPLLASTRTLGERLQRPGRADPVGHGLTRMTWLIDAVLRHARAVVLAGTGVTLLLAVSAAWLRPENKFEYQIPTGSDAYQALAHCDDVFGGIQFVRVLVEWPATMQSDDARVMTAIGDAQALLAAEPDIHEVVSVRDLLAVLPGGGDGRSRLPMLRLAPVDVRARFWRPDDRRALVTARVPDLGMAHLEPVFARIEQGLERLQRRHNGFRLRLTGAPLVGSRFTHEIIGDLLKSLSVAAGIILIVMGLVFRSVRIGLITVIPNLLFHEQGEKEGQGNFSCVIEADDLDGAVGKSAALIESLHKKAEAFEGIDKVFLDEIVQVNSMPDEGFVSHWQWVPGATGETVSTVLPEVADEHCEAFSPEFEDETEDEDGESTTVGPFITFD